MRNLRATGEDLTATLLNNDKRQNKQTTILVSSKNFLIYRFRKSSIPQQKSLCCYLLRCIGCKNKWQRFHLHSHHMKKHTDHLITSCHASEPRGQLFTLQFIPLDNQTFLTVTAYSAHTHIQGGPSYSEANLHFDGNI